MDPLTGRRDRAPLRTEERRLLQRFRDGEERAFHDLLRPHLGPLLALARRRVGDPHWAEDLVQETLVRVHGALGGFRGESSLRTWLFRILLRLASEPERWRRQDGAKSLREPLLAAHLLGSRLEESMAAGWALTRQPAPALQDLDAHASPGDRHLLRAVLAGAKVPRAEKWIDAMELTGEERAFLRGGSWTPEQFPIAVALFRRASSS